MEVAHQFHAVVLNENEFFCRAFANILLSFEMRVCNHREMKVDFPNLHINFKEELKILTTKRLICFKFTNQKQTLKQNKTIQTLLRP